MARALTPVRWWPTGGRSSRDGVLSALGSVTVLTVVVVGGLAVAASAGPGAASSSITVNRTPAAAPRRPAPHGAGDPRPRAVPAITPARSDGRPSGRRRAATTA